jgi:hypothetical protein
LNCPPGDQKPLHKDAFEVITSELNKLHNNFPQDGGGRRALVAHFIPFITTYKNLINYEGEGVKNFQQLSTYMSETFETNIKGKNLHSIMIINSFYLVNVQKNFVKKINNLLTELIIKRNRNINLQTLRTRKRNIFHSVIFNGGDIQDELFQIDTDKTLMTQIRAILPSNIHPNGLQYDITIRPEAYLNSYIALSHLFDQYGLRSFNSVPLSTSTIPRYIIIDTKILLQNILGVTQRVEINAETKPGYWAQVFNLENKAFKRKRGDNNESSFTGMIRTDLVGVSVNIGPPPSKGRKVFLQKNSKFIFIYFVREKKESN